MITIDLLLHAQAVSNLYQRTRPSRVFAKAIKDVDAGKPLSADFIESIKSCIKKIQFDDKTMRLEKLSKEWNKQ